MTSKIYIITGEHDAQQYMQKHPHILPAHIPVIRRQLWQSISNAGLLPTLNQIEERSAEDLAQQAQTALAQIADTVPLFVNALGLSKTLQDKLTLLLGAHPIHPRDIETLLPADAPKKSQLWTLERLRDALVTFIDNPTLALPFNTPGPAFVYAAFAAALKNSSVIPRITVLGAADQLPLPALPLSTQQKENDSAPYTCHVTEDHTSVPSTLRLDFSLHSTFDLVAFTHSTTLPFPEIPRDRTVVLSGKMPIAVFAIMARSLMAAGQKEVALFTPQQTVDANMASPALVIAPAENLRYIESFPPNLVRKLLEGLSMQSTTPRQRTKVDQLLHQQKVGEVLTLDREIFRAYCRVFSTALYADEQIQRFGHGLSDRTNSLVQDMKARAITTILDHLENPHRTLANLASLEMKNLVFGSLLKQFFQSPEATLLSLKQGEVPHLSFSSSFGPLADEVRTQVAAWYLANYTDQDFGQKLAEDFLQTDFTSSVSHHFALYYHPNEQNAEKKTLIGYMRFSESSDFPGRRYISNLHIAPEFQSYGLIRPFMQSSLETEGLHGAYALHAEPNSAAEHLYLDSFDFRIQGEKILYMLNSSGAPIYLNLLLRGYVTSNTSEQLQ